MLVIVNVLILVIVVVACSHDVVVVVRTLVVVVGDVMTAVLQTVVGRATFVASQLVKSVIVGCVTVEVYILHCVMGVVIVVVNVPLLTAVHVDVLVVVVNVEVAIDTVVVCHAVFVLVVNDVTVDVDVCNLVLVKLVVTGELSTIHKVLVNDGTPVVIVKVTGTVLVPAFVELVTVTNVGIVVHVVVVVNVVKGVNSLFAFALRFTI